MSGAPTRTEARLHHGSIFRIAPEGAQLVRTTEQLEEQLRRRLRVHSVIWALATGVVALIALVERQAQLRADPSTIWTQPPLPGVLVVISLVTFAAVWLLAPHRRLGLTRLRAVEWFGVAMTATFLVIDEALDLRGMQSVLAIKPMDLGLGLGAPWGALIVAYGVLIPSSLRHSVVRTIVLLACSFLPELLVLPEIGGIGPGIPTYLAMKGITVLVLSALALYGSYRIGELTESLDSARRLGQYVLKQTLGAGGMGTVYLAQHQLLRRPCAVKLIRDDLANDEATIVRFEREVQAAAALTHPNTVQIYDYGRTEDGTFYYAMEYLPGIALEELVQREGPQPVPRVISILVQLCGALGEAHGRGLVHRDLKPGNVMLCERGGMRDVVKLLDFGLVAGLRDGRPDGRVTRAETVMGTPDFMSPEQARGDGQETALSDIYSLGVLGYFLLTGRAPFEGRAPMEILAAQLYEAPEPIAERRPDIPPRLAITIMRCLAKDPGERYPNATALRRALENAALDAQPVVGITAPS